MTGAMEAPEGGIVAAVLAAGGSSRFGSDSKLVAQFRGEPMVSIAVNAALAAGCFDHVLVVTGAVDLSETLPAGVRTVFNEAWATGQASSVRAAADAARELGAAFVVIGLADQPFVKASAWHAVAMAPTDVPILVASYEGRRGNPVRLRHDVWDDLPEEGDEGARVLIRSNPGLVSTVACSGSAIDIDTQEDLDRWN